MCTRSSRRSGPTTAFELAFWLWDYGLIKGVCTPEAVALSRTAFVARVDELYPELELPDSNEVVDACLDHVTGTFTRIDKNLIDAAYLLRHNLTATSRLDELHRERLSRR